MLTQNTTSWDGELCYGFRVDVTRDLTPVSEITESLGAEVWIAVYARNRNAGSGCLKRNVTSRYTWGRVSPLFARQARTKRIRFVGQLPTGTLSTGFTCSGRGLARPYLRAQINFLFSSWAAWVTAARPSSFLKQPS